MKRQGCRGGRDAEKKCRRGGGGNKTKKTEEQRRAGNKNNRLEAWEEENLAHAETHLTRTRERRDRGGKRQMEERQQESGFVFGPQRS